MAVRIWLAASAFFPHRGGVEELTLKLAQHLAARGHEVLVIAPRHPAELPDADVVEGVDVVRLTFRAPRRNFAEATRYLRSRRSLHRQLDALLRPDLVHVICPSVQLDPVGRWARRRGIPLVLTSQGETEMDANGLYRHSAWMRYVLRREASRATALTACSRWTADRAAAIAAEFTGATVVLNGVDPADWEVEDPANEPVVAAWGRHVPQKGLDLLVRAFPQVRQVLPDAVLRIGGHGPQSEELRSLAGEGIEFLGSLDRQGVRTLLAGARVAVVPSRVEPFGIVALEALGAGRALVYSKNGGLAEAAGGLGHGVDPEDAAALARAIVTALRSPADPSAGRARAQELSWSAITDQYLEVYGRALAA